MIEIIIFIIKLFKDLLIIISLSLLTILVHELGHYAVLRKYTHEDYKDLIELRFIVPKLCFKLGHAVHYECLSNKQMIDINSSGIVAGWLFILPLLYIFPINMTVWVSVLYFFGTMNDWVRIFTYMKEIKKNGY